MLNAECSQPDTKPVCHRSDDEMSQQLYTINFLQQLYFLLKVMTCIFFFSEFQRLKLCVLNTLFLETPLNKSMCFALVFLHSCGWHNCCWSQHRVSTTSTRSSQLWGQTQRRCCWAESSSACRAKRGQEKRWWRHHLQQHLSRIAEGDKWEQQQQRLHHWAERLVFKVVPLPTAFHLFSLLLVKAYFFW